MRLRLLLLSVKNIQMMSQLCEQLIFIHSMQKHSLSRLNNKWISFLIYRRKSCMNFIKKQNCWTQVYWSFVISYRINILLIWPKTPRESYSFKELSLKSFSWTTQYIHYSMLLLRSRKNCNSLTQTNYTNKSISALEVFKLQ